jgi:hypothetical protein
MRITRNERSWMLRQLKTILLSEMTSRPSFPLKQARNRYIEWQDGMDVDKPGQQSKEQELQRQYLEKASDSSPAALLSLLAAFNS